VLPNYLWAERIRRLHKVYCYFVPTYAILVASLLTLAAVCQNTVLLDAGYHCNRAFLAVVGAQIISARLVFFRCPLSLLEDQLRGYDEVKRYWVARLPAQRAIILLAAVPVVFFIAILCIFECVIPWP